MKTRISLSKLKEDRRSFFESHENKITIDNYILFYCNKRGLTNRFVKYHDLDENMKLLLLEALQETPPDDIVKFSPSRSYQKLRCGCAIQCSPEQLVSMHNDYSQVGYGPEDLGKEVDDRSDLMI